MACVSDLRKALHGFKLSDGETRAIAYLVSRYARRVRGNGAFHDRTPADITSRLEMAVKLQFDWEAPSLNWQWRTSKGLLAEMGFYGESRKMQTELAYAMKAVGLTRTKRSNGKNLRLVPPVLASGTAPARAPLMTTTGVESGMDVTGQAQDATGNAQDGHRAAQDGETLF